MNNKRRTRWEVVALLVLGLVVWVRALADGSGPIYPFPITGAYSAFHREDRNHISVIEIAGNYDRDLSGGQSNVEPRAVVAREFFRTHPDNYDFLVAFSTFEFSTGEALAFHWAVQNKVQGIGIREFDNSALFGSQGKLQGFIDMAALTRYKTDPLDPGFETVLGTLAHELLHQWGSFVRFKNPDGSLNDALLGRDNAHWSYLVDSDASVEYGADWKDNGDGSFSAIGVRKFFSPLDLYLMGFYKPEEVPPFFLIENPAIDKAQLPKENVTVTGSKRLVTIDDIIAAEGPRVPAAGDAQKDFRVGFILLTGPGEPVSDAQIAALNHVRNAFMTRFAILTAGRATAQVYPEALPVETVGTPTVIGGGELRQTPVSLDDGMAWLRGKQDAQGFWTDKPNTAVRDTVTSLSTLTQLDLAFNNAAPALGWLNQNASTNTDYLARHAATLSELGGDATPVRATLAGLQNSDGGWGIAAGYRSDPLDTALAVLALANGGATQAALDQAGQYLLAQQNADGGWSNAGGGPSRTTVTTTVLRALGKHAPVAPAALTWLAAKQNTDGGFGDSPSTVHDTATALQTFMAFDAITQIRPDDAANYLFSRQTVEGSWEGSVYSTATALAALKRFSFPNWAVTAMSADPLSPLDGQRVLLGITVKNDSNVIAQPGVLRVYDGDPASGGTAIGPDIPIPLLGPGAAVSFAPIWDSFDKAGLHTLYALVDPDGQQTEMSERDNRAAVKVSVQPAPPGVDLVVSTPDVVISPSNPDTLPTSLGLSVNVRNAGLTDARNVRIRVWQGAPGTGTLVGEAIVDILARTTVVANFSSALTTPGTVVYTVQVDPDNTVAEASETNNSAVGKVSTAPSVDLAVGDGDISVDRNPAYLGDDVTFRITLRNRGTVDAPPAPVNYLITDGTTTRTLRTNTVEIGAGQSVEQTLTWRVDLTGSLTFTAQLDPDGLVPETDEGNNAGSLVLPAGSAVGPNLAVSYQEFTISPLPGNEGSDLVLSAVVRNTGSVAAGDFDVSFYNGDPQQGGVALGTMAVPGLAAGATTRVSFTWTAVPSSGDKLLFVVADAAKVIAESNEEDNAAFNVATIIALPDLAISAADIGVAPAFPKAGDTVTLSARVTNLGQQAAANVTVRAFDGDPATGGTQVGGDQVIALIAGNSEATVHFSWDFTATGGVRPIVVQVDPANAILERNKTNNSARRDIAIQDGNFYVTEPYFSPNGDGVKDSTRFFFRLSAETNVTVEVVDKRGKVVRRFIGAGLQGVDAGDVLWDGLDELGRLVADGRYQLRVLDTAGATVGDAFVTLDTDRSSLLEAIGTRFESFTNLTCELKDTSGLVLTADESQAFFFTNAMPTTQDPQPAYPKGVYRMAGDGTDIRNIVPAAFFKTTSEVPGRNYPPYNADITRLAAAANGSRVALMRRDNWTNKEWPLWVVDADGGNLHPANIRPSSWGQAWLSPDGATVYTVGSEVQTDYNGNALLATAADGTGTPIKLLEGTDEGSVKFSPDGRRVAAYARNGGATYALWIVDTQTGVAVQPPDVAAGIYLGDFEWSPNGARLAVMDRSNNRIVVLDASGNLVREIANPIPPVPDSGVNLETIAWSPNSAEFSFKSWPEYYGEGGFVEGILDPGGIYTADVSTGTAEKVATFRAQTGCGECASYHISTWDGSQWVKRGELHFGLHYEEKEFDLSAWAPKNGGDFRVRIRQRGLEAAHVDSVALNLGQARLLPASALHLGTSRDVLPKVLYPDNVVLDLHEQEMEVRWENVPAGRLRLALKAREEKLTGRKAIPFTYPAESGHVYNYVVRGNRPMLVDGRQTAQDGLGDPLFKVYSRPGTGHPAADVYGYVQSDGKYLYAALDFAVDNTEDKDKDWAALRVKTGAGWKEFRVTAVDKTHGTVGFRGTGAVPYDHKYYEIRVPLTELGASEGDTLDIAFQAYGTAAIIIPEGDGLDSYGDLYWVPGERALLYRSWEYEGQRHTAILLDEGNRQRTLFDDWGNDFDSHGFSPTGRQLLFASGRATWDPTSVCYQQGYTDEWTFRSLLNLTADLRAIRSATGGVRLEGTASDLNFANYALDYTEAASPDNWRPVQPAASEPVVDERFTMWVPPGPGTYFVRLTSTDLAGNVRQRVKRVAWADTPSITDVYRTPAYISPNGDGVQDEATIHYRVLEPVHLEFNFYNATGDRVRTIARDHSAVGAEFNLIWDGRDDRGLPVADGVYRMTVQNYEFFVTVDATPPVNTIRLQDPYQKSHTEFADPATGETVTDDFVAVQPLVQWSVTDSNYADSALERGTGANPNDWQVFADVDPGERGQGEVNTRQLVLLRALNESTNYRFRVAATDRAGNRTVESTALGVEQLIVSRFGNLAINPLMVKAWDEGLLRGPRIEYPEREDDVGPYRIINPVLYVPMDRDDGGQKASVTVSPGETRIVIAESIRADLVQIHAQFREPDSSVWREAPIKEFLTGALVAPQNALMIERTNQLSQHAPQAIWDLAGLEPGKTYVARVRAVDTTGKEHLSNTFRFRVGGYSFNGLIAPNPYDPRWAQLVSPLVDPPIERGEYFLWGQELIARPVAEVQLFVQSKEDARYPTFRHLGSASYPDGTFVFRTKDITACKNYVGYVVLLGEPGPDGARAELGRTGPVPFRVPCLTLEVKPTVRHAAACGDPSPNKLHIEFLPSSLDGTDLKLLTLARQDPATGEDIVFNVNKPVTNRIYQYELDTAGLPEGTIPFRARLVNVNDLETMRNVDVVVDHTPPTQGIDYPLAGQRVCATAITGEDGKVRNVLTLEGRISDANGFHYEVDSGVGDNPGTFDSFHVSRTFDSIKLANGQPAVFDEPRDEHHIRNPLQGPLAALIDRNGTITARLRVFDMGGFQQCSTRTFTVDGVVETRPVAVNRGLFSPNGDGVLDDVTLTYGAEETVTVDVDVHAALPDGIGGYQITGPVLRKLVSQRQILAGEESVVWDGRGDNGSVPADGVYGVVVTHKDACGLVATREVFVHLDNTPPAVTVAYPKTGDPLPMVVEVQGSVTDPHLQAYGIDFGVGALPEAWLRLASGTREITGTSLLASWNTYGLEGAHAIRVVASDLAGNETVAVVPLTIVARTNLISYLEAVPALFSPNGDGRRESTALRFGLEQDAVVTLAILDAGGAVRRTLASGQGMVKGAASVNWDGRDDQGAVLPDGKYTVGLLAVLASNPLLRQEEKITATVDSTPPVVAITRPASGFVPAAGGIIGDIADQHLSAYTVSLTDTPQAPAWTELQTGTDSRSGFTFGSLAGRAEGEYALRVEAKDEGESVTATVVPFIIDNTPPKVDLTAPADGVFVGVKKSPVEIKGSVEEKYLKHYRLEFGAGAEPTAWTVLATGTALPLPDVLKTWDVSALSDGLYTVRLVAEDKASLRGEKRIALTVDNTPPEAMIATPAENGYVRQPLDIAGTAADANLADYRLELAPGEKDSSTRWSELGVGAVAVANGTLLNWQALPPDGTHTLRLSVKDKADNTAEALVQVQVDTHPPAKPLDLKAVVENRQDVRLTWQASSEPDVIGYALYRDGQRITPELVPTPEYLDRALPEGKYQYTVAAWDRAGWESERSDPAGAVIDITPPTARIQAPAALSAVSGLQDVRGTAHAVDDFREYRLYVAPAADPDSRLLLRRSPVPVLADLLSQWNTVGLPEGEPYLLRLEAEDINGNTGSDEVTVAVDNLPPAPPTGLVAVPSGANVQLTWNANTEPDLYGYLVFRGVRLANVTGTVVGELKPYAVITTAYPDLSLPDGPYSYTIIAIDRAGNLSDPSVAADVVIDTRAPHAVIVQPTAGTMFDTPLYILATSQDTDVAQVQFQYRAAGGTWVNLGAADTALPYEAMLDPVALGLSRGSYELKAIATDTGNKVDPAPTPVAVTYTDVTRPVMTLGLINVVNGGDVTLTWTANTETDLAGYHIDRRSAQGTQVRLTGVPIAGTTLVDSGLEDDTYYYTVTAIDLAGNEADPTPESAAVVYTPQLAQPYTPTRNALVTLEGKGVGPARVAGEMANSAGTTALPEVDADAQGAFQLPDLALTGGDNSFTLRMTDAAGNVSKPASTIVTAGIAPGQPTGLSATANGYNVTLGWTANPEPNVVGYRVFRGGEPLLPESPIADGAVSASSSVMPASHAYDLNADSYWSPATDSLTPAAGQWLAVSWAEPRLLSQIRVDWRDVDYRAVDYDIEAWSGSAWVRVAQVRDNTEISNIIALAEPYRTMQVRLVLRRIALPDYYWQGLQLAEFGLMFQPLEATTAFIDVVPDGNHEYTITAVNSHGFESIPSEPAQLPVGDVTPPEPAILSGTVAGSDVTLTWTASTSPDVVRYLLYRDGVLIATHTDLGYLSSLDIGRPNGRYLYTVKAVDGANNESVPSNEASVTVAIAPPVAPVNLVATVVPAGKALDLAWAPGAGLNPAGYRVLRSTTAGGPYTAIADTTETFLRDSGVTNGVTYYYVVLALDALTNPSVSSNEADGTPLDQLAPAIALHYPTVPGRLHVSPEPSASIIGTTEPGASVTLFGNGSVAGTAIAERVPQVHGQDLPAEYGSVRLSPDGRYVAYQNDQRELRLRNLDSGDDLLLATLQSWGYLNIRWSADGQRITFVDEDPQYYNYVVRTYDRRTGSIENITDPSEDYVYVGVPSPDGSRYAVPGYLNGEEGLWLIDAATGERNLLVSGGGWSFLSESLRWSPDGSRIAYVRTDSSWTAEFVTVVSGAVQTVETQAGGILSWSPDGTALAYTSWRTGSAQIRRYQLADGSDIALTQEPSVHSDPAWTPDGQAILMVTDDVSLDLLNLADGTSTRLVTATDYVDGWELQSLASAYLGFWADDQWRRMSLSGRFELKNVALEPGDNVFTATAHDASGNAGVTSAPIVINYKTDDRPDLAVTMSDLRILPAAPALGEAARVTVTVRNLGSKPSPAAGLSIIAVAPDGTGTTLLQGQQLPVIAAGAAATLSADWTVAGAAGDYSLVAIIDPLNEVLEISEANNLAIRDLRVAGDAQPGVRITTERQAYAVNEDVVATVRLDNSGDSFDGRLEVVIEDATGSLVQKILVKDVAALGYSEVRTEVTGWNTDSVFAGGYGAHARLYNTAGTMVAESVATFTIGAAQDVSGRVATDKAVYLANSDVLANATFDYAGGNTVLSGVEAVLRLVDGNDLILAEEKQLFGDLLPGASNSLSLRWNTGVSPVGPYAVKLVVSQAGAVLATATSAFAIETGSAQLAGTLLLSDQAPAAGSPQVATYAIRNQGNAALTQVPVTVSLVDPVLQATLEQHQVTVDLPVGGEATGSAAFSTIALALRNYTVLLQADVPDNQGGDPRVTLATVGFPLVDRTAPLVNVQKPTADGFFRSEAKSTVFARDELSAVATVEISVDGGVWVTVPVDSAPSSLYGDLLRNLAEGVHTVAARATDTYGNTGTTGTYSFVVDNLSPSIAINGVADGAYYNHDVAAEIVVTDLHLKEQFSDLNGATYVSGGAITVDAPYRLNVLARDYAGNQAERSLQFVVDKSAPQIVVTGVAEGGIYNADVTPIIEVSDANLKQATILLNDTSFDSGTTVVAEGAYQLRIAAEDLAGNSAATAINFVVDKTPPRVTITAPTDGAILTSPTVEVTGQTEPLATVYLATGSYTAETFADSAGNFAFAQVPVTEAENVISVHARDQAGNEGSPASVTVRVASVNLKGEIRAPGEVLAWIPVHKKDGHCHDHGSDHDHGHGKGDDRHGHDRKEKNHHECHHHDDRKGDDRDVRDDAGHEHDERLIGRLADLLDGSGRGYRIVHDESEFVIELRSGRYGTLLLAELHRSEHDAECDGRHDDKARDKDDHGHDDGGKDDGKCRHDQGRPVGLKMHKETQLEVRAAVAGGAGLVWVKTHPDHNEHWEDVVGAKGKGEVEHLAQVELDDSPASKAGLWTVDGDAMRVQLAGGTGVGRLVATSKHDGKPTGPALVLHTYGHGRTVLFTFDPSAVSESAAGAEMLERAIEYVANRTAELVAGGVVETYWQAEDLKPPLTVKFDETLVGDMSFLDALDGGTVSSPVSATWTRALEADRAQFRAIVQLPGAPGTYPVTGELYKVDNTGVASLVKATFDVTVAVESQQLALDLMDSLMALSLAVTREPGKVEKVMEYVQEATIRVPASRRDVEFSIEMLLKAMDYARKVPEAEPVVVAQLGSLLRTYQIRWHALR